METMFTQMQQFYSELGTAARAQLARWDALWPDVQRAQAQGVARLDAAIDESAQWGKQSLAVWSEMTRASLAMVRHGFDSVVPRAPGT